MRHIEYKTNIFRLKKEKPVSQQVRSSGLGLETQWFLSLMFQRSTTDFLIRSIKHLEERKSWKLQLLTSYKQKQCHLLQLVVYDSQLLSLLWLQNAMSALTL